MAATRKQKGGAKVAGKRKFTVHRSRRRSPPPPRRRVAPRPSRNSSRNVGSPRNECASLYSAQNYIPQIPNISNEEKDKRLDKVRARIDELGCGNSGRTD